HGDFRISPDGRWMVWTSEAVDTPPRTTLHGADGTLVATLAEADVAPLTSLGVPTPELVSVPAADGASTLYGVLYKPTGFNPAEQYPLLVDVYGGPHVRTVSNRFIGGRPECELGMLVLQVDNRGTPGRGKAFESATYLKLGIV